MPSLSRHLGLYLSTSVLIACQAVPTAVQLPASDLAAAREAATMIAVLRDLESSASQALPNDMQAKAQTKQTVTIQTPSGVTGTAITEVIGDSPSVTRTYERTLRIPDGRQSVQSWSGTFRYDYRTESASITETLPDGRKRSVERISSVSAPSNATTLTGKLMLSDGQVFLAIPESQVDAKGQQVLATWQRPDKSLTLRLVVSAADTPALVRTSQGINPADTVALPTVETGLVR